MRFHVKPSPHSKMARTETALGVSRETIAAADQFRDLQVDFGRSSMWKSMSSSSPSPSRSNSLKASTTSRSP